MVLKAKLENLLQVFGDVDHFQVLQEEVEAFERAIFGFVQIPLVIAGMWIQHG